MSWNPYDYNRGAPGVRIGTQRRSPNDPDSGNPQGTRGVILWLLLIFLIGVLPAGALIYWGYFVPLMTWCSSHPLIAGELCDFTSGLVHHHYDYSQAFADELFKQWVERVIGIVWALLTLRYVVVRLRQNAAVESFSADEPGASLGAPPASPDRSGAYVRDRILSTLNTLGMVVCGLGVLALILVPPEIFPM
jgi:hypothetical protein